MRSKRWKSDWEQPEFIYLGTEANPASGMVYDYYFHSYDDARLGSCIARHGDDPADYGSVPLACSSAAGTPEVGQDYIFGMARAEYLALVYLHLGKRPLVPEPFMDEDEEQSHARTDLGAH